MAWLACLGASGIGSDADPAAQRISLDKPPTAIVVSRDGRTLFVGLDRRLGIDGGIVAYRRDGATFAKAYAFEVAEGVLGLAITPDERTLVASTPVGLVAIDTAALLRGAPVATTVLDGDAPGTNQLVVSRDGGYVLFTNTRDATLGVARLHTRSPAADIPGLTIVGHVALDRLPGGLALSRDGSELFITSEIDNVDPTHVAGAGDPRLARTRCEANFGPHGVLTIVSVETAIRTPLRAVLARSAAGCAPVRVALAPGGDVAWVSDRGEARILAFDVARLRAGTDALLASVAVGNDPVGVAVSSDGRNVLVANSNRADEPERGSAGTLTLLDVEAVLHGSAAVPATLPAGALPREVVAISNGSYYVTNYNGRSIDIVTPGR